MVVWTAQFPPKFHVARPNDPQPTESVAFVIHFTRCPEDEPVAADAPPTDFTAEAAILVDTVSTPR